MHLIQQSTRFFDDGIKKIDFILAYRKAVDEDIERENRRQRDVLKTNLRKMGINIEDTGKANNNRQLVTKAVKNNDSSCFSCYKSQGVEDIPQRTEFIKVLFNKLTSIIINNNLLISIF